MADDDQGLLLGDAARALEVSTDTLRRWERAGKLHTTRDGANRRRVPTGEIERLARRPVRHSAVGAQPLSGGRALRRDRRRDGAG